jgi:hypothetical protein
MGNLGRQRLGWDKFANLNHDEHDRHDEHFTHQFSFFDFVFLTRKFFRLPLW